MANKLYVLSISESILHGRIQEPLLCSLLSNQRSLFFSKHSALENPKTAHAFCINSGQSSAVALFSQHRVTLLCRKLMISIKTSNNGAVFAGSAPGEKTSFRLFYHPV